MEKRAKNVQTFIDTLCGDIDDATLEILTNCESPIEELFCLGLMAELDMLGTDKRDADFTFFFEAQQKITTSDGDVHRIDFLITMYDALFDNSGEPITDWETQLIVECDGWEYHSTKARIESDNERDAKILSEYGIPTVRFLGRKINADPCLCARQAIGTIRKLNENYRRQIEISVSNTLRFSDRLRVSHPNYQIVGEQ